MNKANTMLAKLDSALKGITEITTYGDSILQPEKFDRFIRQAEQGAVVLPEARFVTMMSQKMDIDRTGFVGRILKSGRDGSNDVRVLATGEFSNPSFNTNQLSAVELQAIASLRDDGVRRNIERGNFENTLLDIMGEAVGRDLEEFALLADSNIPYGTDDVLSLTDGWVRLAEQKLYGVGASKDFDPTSDEFPENMFNEMLSALPKQYLGNVADWRIYVTWDVYDAYRDLLRARGTQLGDSAQTTDAPLFYKGFRVVYCPFLERAGEVSDATTDVIEGKIALMSNPDNMVWGIFHRVTVEPEREAKARRTDFILTFEGDMHYEDENAAVAALIEKQAPSA